jgi:hypothetical protein
MQNNKQMLPKKKRFCSKRDRVIEESKKLNCGFSDACPVLYPLKKGGGSLLITFFRDPFYNNFLGLG